MAQNSQPLDLEEALTRLYAAMPVISETERVAITEARGRILAEPVPAPLNLPPFAASAMDGYALRRADFEANPQRSFSIIDSSLAGHPCAATVGPGECVRIFTGAKLPDGADQVLLQEEALDASATEVSFRPHHPPETYIRPIGHDVHAGVELALSHDHLTAFTLGALAAAGVDRISVFKLPTVGVFSTGDELVEPGTAVADLREGQIYDSNRFTVLNLLRDSPCELLDLGRLADDPVEVATAFADASKRCNILLTSGGVSVGDTDFVTTTIQQMGSLEFWRLNLKPGKPLAFGRIGNCFVFGLPGNPVSTIVTALLLAKPAIWHYAGAHPRTPLRVQAIVASQISHTPGRAEYQRGNVNMQAGALMVSGTGDQSSNRLSTFRGANCLIEVPAEAADLASGAHVMVLPFEGLLA